MAANQTIRTAETRDRIIIKTSVIGIVTNVLLAAFKAVVGIVSNSIAVTLDEILGVRADKETTDRIRETLVREPEVRGAYDLVLHNYGPDKNLASVHVELPDTMTVKEVDKLTRRAEARVYKETGVILTAVGVYSYNTGDTEAARIENDVRARVLAHDWTLQLHGFYLDMENKEMQIDVVMSFDIKPREGVKILCEEIEKAYPGYKIHIAPDVDVAD